MMESHFKDPVTRTEAVTVEELRKELNFDLAEVADTKDLEKELLQVYLRVRPFSQTELDNGESQDCITIHAPDTVLLKAPRTSLSARLSDKSVPQTAQRFQFSHVFGPDTSQKDMFDSSVKSLVQDVLEGRNSLVFTYGVTNAGKTFTFIGPEHDVGVLPRSLNMIFSSLEGHVFSQMSLKPQRCQDVLKLTREQQAEEAISKRNLLRLLKETEAQKSLQTSKTLEGLELEKLDGSVSDRSSSLDIDVHTKFSIWVSFCEIYNENIHDLLEQLPNSTVRRTNLRLCQDIKGNSFIKDLRWVQVNSADEAFKVMKLGKKNQSISSTKLNQLSSRSHSIFSVRILRVDDAGIPRVQSVSELSLCDLAGSERCGKTQNVGDRLKEAGNINTSLLSLGKCITALKNNQHAKHHVPFRESKLTHYLQGYFTGRGRACMIVNVNQCASMFDETLNVLKFSAVAQKVVILSTATVLPLVVNKRAREFSFLINKECERSGRRTSLLCWERSLDDVQEDADSEEEEEEEEESVMEGTLLDSDDEEGKETVLLDKEMYEHQLRLVEELRGKLKQAKADNLVLESRIREEVTKEFSDLFSQMQTDYNERISQERQLIEERCERRLEIFKNLVGKSATDPEGDGEGDCDGGEEAKVQENESSSLDGMLDSMSCDLAGIRQDAEAAQSCLVTSDPQTSANQLDLENKITVLTEQLSELKSQLESKTQELDSQNSVLKDLEEMKKTLESREQKLTDLMVMCVEKDDMISKVQAALDQSVEDAAKNSTMIKDLLELKQNCTCPERRAKPETRKRRQEEEACDGLQGQPPLKKGPLDNSNLPEDLAPDSPEVKGDQEDERILEQEHQTLQKKKEKEKPTSETNYSSQAGEAELDAINCRLDELSREVVEKNTLIGSLEQEVAGLKEEAGHISVMLKELQEEAASKEEVVKVLENQLAEQKANQNNLHTVNSDLHAEVANLNELITGLKDQLRSDQVDQNKMVEEETKEEALEQKETVLLDKEETLKQKETVLLHKEEALKQKETVLFDKEETLKQKETVLLHKEEALKQKETVLLHKEEALKQKETVLLHKEETLKQKETVLLDKEETLQQKETVLLDKKETLKQKEAELIQPEKADSKTAPRLVSREEELRQKEEQLSGLQKHQKEVQERVEELSQKEVELSQKEVALLQKEEELSQKEEELSQKEEELNQKEVALLQKEAQLSGLQKGLKEEQERVEVEELSQKKEEQLSQKEVALLQKEAQLSALQKQLKEVQERVEEQELQAVQETRRREAERRRELLAVAEEAIAQKDAELLKRQEEINRLKEEMKSNSEKVRSLSVDLQRREDDSADLKEKLTDSKKQIQQVQKEISSMRDAEKTLRQKVMDLEKAKTQLQNEVSNRDRTIQQLKNRSSDPKTEDYVHLYEKTQKDLQVRDRVIEDMRLALTEQEETQTQLDLELDDREAHIQELTQELEKLKEVMLKKRNRDCLPHQDITLTDELTQAKEEASQAQENLNLAGERYQTERKKWLEEKQVLISQVKEAEERRNQDMRRYADDRERHTRQHTEMESLSARLAEREEEMERWRKERDSLVSVLEVQLKKLVSTIAEKDQQIQQLKCTDTPRPPEGDVEGRAEELQLQLNQKQEQIQRLEDQLNKLTNTHTQSSGEAPASSRRDSSTQTLKLEDLDMGRPLDTSTLKLKRKTRGSVTSQVSCGSCPSVIDSSEVSTETGRRSRFPRPEVEIAFSSLQPDRFALKRHGEESAVTVKISRSARKRKSGEIEKEGVEVENRRNMRFRTTSRLPAHQEEEGSPALLGKNSHESQSSLRGKKEGTLQKIGGFLHSSPTFLGSKAKRIMGLMSGKSPDDGGSLSYKYPKRKLHRPNISSPMDIPAHQIIAQTPVTKDSEHPIKRRLRIKTPK